MITIELVQLPSELKRNLPHLSRCNPKKLSKGLSLAPIRDDILIRSLCNEIKTIYVKNKTVPNPNMSIFNKNFHHPTRIRGTHYDSAAHRFVINKKLFSNSSISSSDPAKFITYFCHKFCYKEIKFISC